MFTITNPETGHTYEFASEAAYDAAAEWFDGVTKGGAIEWFVDLDNRRPGGPVGEIWADENCTKLVADWDDIILALRARAPR
jgi:hypothetical protein